MPDQTEVSRPRRIASCLGYLLFHLALCYVFTLIAGWFEMTSIIGKGTPVAEEEMGAASMGGGAFMFVVLFILAPIACCMATPFHLLVYFKASRQRKHWLSLPVSITCALLVVMPGHF